VVEKISVSTQRGEFQIPKGKLLGLDQVPMDKGEQRWGSGAIVTTFWGIGVTVASMMLSAGLLLMGLNWIQVMIACFIASLICVVVFLLNGVVGKNFGIPHTVQLRFTFGTRIGTYIPTILRAIAGLFWAGIMTWIMAQCADGIIGALSSGWAALPSFPRTLGLFVILTGVQYIFMHYEYKGLRYLAVWGVPIFVVAFIIAIIWMYNITGTWGPVFEAGSKYAAWAPTSVFITAIVIILGAWTTLFINISDLTRATHLSTKRLGVSIGIGWLGGMLMSYFLGIIVLSMSVVQGLGEEWNPVIWVIKFPVVGLAITILFFIFAVQLTTNLQANVLSPTVTLCNLFRKLSFKKSSAIILVISLFTVPWVLLSHASTLLQFVSNFGTVLGGVAGVMIADYYLVHKRKLNLAEAYVNGGIYSYFRGGINYLAIAAFVIAVILAASFIDYGAIVGVVSGFVVYIVLIALGKRLPVIRRGV